MIMILLVQSMVEVLEAYFERLTEEVLRDNFVLVYELLDEMADFGYPQVLSPQILKQYIVQQLPVMLQKALKKVGKGTAASLAQEASSAPSAAGAATDAVPWRPKGLKYKKNEVYLDVIEKLDILVAADGTVLSSDIAGVVRLKTKLTGMPELKLGLNDAAMLQAARTSSRRAATASRSAAAVNLEDVRFHQCVRLAHFERDKVITFIPPDGEFDLMEYRMRAPVKPPIWVETVAEQHPSRISYVVTVKSAFKNRITASDITVMVPVPPDADTPKFSTKHGHARYMPESDCIAWTMSSLRGQREYSLRASFGLPSAAADDSARAATWRRPISVQFEIPYYTVSGLQVRYLKVTEKSGYEALPWVRYMTRNGDYHLRMS